MSSYDPGRWRTGFFAGRAALTFPILSRALIATAWSIAVHWMMKHGFVRSFGSLGHTLIGVPFALLLVFRTNTSYDRFWEGRRLWGAIVEETRHLARHAAVDLPPALRDEFRVILSVFAHALMHSLRGNRALGPHAAALPADLLHQIDGAAHVPTAAMTHASALFRHGIGTDARATAILASFEDSCRSLLLCAGGCNRIRSTPVPFPYTVHLRRALVVYAATVPFAFASEFGWLCVPATLIVTFILFGIEELGVNSEDPFGFDPGDLPLEAYCQAIDATLFDKSLDAIAARKLDPAGS